MTFFNMNRYLSTWIVKPKDGWNAKGSSKQVISAQEVWHPDGVSLLAYAYIHLSMQYQIINIHMSISECAQNAAVSDPRERFPDPGQAVVDVLPRPCRIPPSSVGNFPYSPCYRAPRCAMMVNATLPIIDLDSFVTSPHSEASLSECRKVRL